MNTPETYSAQLDEIADKIKGAPNLKALRAAVLEFLEVHQEYDQEFPSEASYADVEMGSRGVDLCYLPTFGGDAPSDTLGVWSWSPTHLLVGDHWGHTKIIERAEWEEILDRTVRARG